MKSKFLIVIIVLLVVIILLGLSWGIFIISSIFSKEPSKPKNKYGEFPFKLIYEKSGERIEVEDVLVVEYLGIGYNEGLGKYNKWNTYYKNSRTESDNSTNNTSIEIFNDYVEGEGSVIISYKLGSCEYYMGLNEVEYLYQSNKVNPGDIVITSPNGTRSITNEELFNNYNIRIIEKSISFPLS